MDEADALAVARIGPLLAAGLRAADAEAATRAWRPALGAGRIAVLAAGKAAPAMARGFAAGAGAGRPLIGRVTVRRDEPVGSLPAGLVLDVADHPLPTRASVAAGRAALALARSLGPGDTLVVLLSGGASALWTVPPNGLSLPQLIAIHRRLLAEGTPIADLNRVRSTLSAIHGGRLAAAAAPARVLTALVSDVPGDDPAIIGSGPTLGRPTGPDTIRAILSGMGRMPRLPPPLPAPPHGDHAILLRPADALAAMAREGEARGLTCHLLGDRLVDNAESLARWHADRLPRENAGRHLLLSGGEASAPVRAPGGRGGRNSHFLLALGPLLPPGVAAAAIDSDGIDGTGPHAGARWLPGTAARLAAAGIEPAYMLSRSDSATAFATAGDLITTGPTGTNVNDLRLILFR
jgi:hydroxypyruvate reductase